MHSSHAGIFIGRVGLDVLTVLKEKRELPHSLITQLFELYSKNITCSRECPTHTHVLHKCNENMNKYVHVTLLSPDYDFLLMEGIRNAFDTYVSPCRRSARRVLARKRSAPSEISEDTDVGSQFSHNV